MPRVVAIYYCMLFEVIPKTVVSRSSGRSTEGVGVGGLVGLLEVWYMVVGLLEVLVHDCRVIGGGGT